MPKERRPAFQFYPADWLSSSSVSLMSPAEEGAYIRLLCHAWMAEDCGLPADDESLRHLSRLGPKIWKSSSVKLRAKFDRIGDRLFNPRLSEERVKQDEWKEKSAEGGRKSTTKFKKQIGLSPEPQSLPGEVLERSTTSVCNSTAGGERFELENFSRIPTLLTTPMESTNGSKGGPEVVHGLVGTKSQPNVDSSSSSSSSSSLQQQQPVVALLMPMRPAGKEPSPFPPEMVQNEYPKVLAAIRKRDPAADDSFARRLMAEIVQRAISNDKFPRDSLEEIDDESVARCVDESYRTGPKNHGTGLLLSRVPQIVQTWAMED